MKQNTPNQRPHRGGFALVVTLLILTLLTVTVVSFFAQTRGDATMADAYADTQSTKQLSDSAINLVIAQIREATLGFIRDDADGSLDTSERLGWASQPGMIRTFDDQGNGYKHFKLYSDDAMIVDDSGLIADTDELQKWTPDTNNAFNALWSDLNAPVAREDGTLVYPVVAPPSSLDGGSGTTIPDGLPVDDPSTLEIQEGIQGYGIYSPPGFTGSTPSAVNNPAPMPVRWLYVLADGTISSATGTDREVTVSGASSTNPIVGRIAFWTDDETTKLNLNTASEGIFWDQPRGNTWMERAVGQADHGGGVFASQQLYTDGNNGVFGFGWSIPLQNEYNRYPGHPATTSLSAVYGDILEVPFDFVRSQTDFENINRYYEISPQYRHFDGSDPATAGSKGGMQVANTHVTEILEPKDERLYASQSEVYFDAERDDDILSPDDIKLREFFTTTTSKAPDTTILGTPRISMWPQMLDLTLRNSKDALLAFCSELRPQDGANTRTDKYYFQRHSPYMGKDDPGSSRNPELDWGITRNTQLYDYIRSLTDEDLPGFGGSLEDKHGTRGRDQILTQIYDFIRGSINIAGSRLTPLYSYAAPLDTSYYGSNINVEGRSMVFPSEPDSGNAAGTRGVSRVPMIRSVSLVFFPTDILKDQDLDPNDGEFKAYANPFVGYDDTKYALQDGSNSNGLPDAPDSFPYPALSPFGNPAPDDADEPDDWVDLNDNGIEGEIMIPNPAYDPTDPSPDAEPPTLFIGERLRIPYTTKFSAAVIVEPVNISPGSPRLDPNVRFRVKGLETLTASGGQKFFSYDKVTIRTSDAAHGTGRNPNNGFDNLLMTSDKESQPRTPFDDDENRGNMLIGNQDIEIEPGGAAADLAARSWLRGIPKFSFGGGTLEIEILDGAANNESNARVLQTVEVRFPISTFPVPTLRRAATGWQVGNNTEDIRGKDYQVDLEVAQLANEGTTRGIHPMSRDLRYYTFMHSGDSENPGDTYVEKGAANTVKVQDTDTKRVFDTEDETYTYTPNSGVSLVNPMNFTDRVKPNGDNFQDFTRANNAEYRNFISSGFIRRGDVVRSVEIAADSIARGDYRLAAAASIIDEDDDLYTPHPDYNDINVQHAHSIRPDGHSGTMGFARAAKGKWGGLDNQGGNLEPFTPLLLPPFIEDPTTPFENVYPDGSSFIDIDEGRYSRGVSPSKGAFHGSLIPFEIPPHDRGTKSALDEDKSTTLLWGDQMPFYSAAQLNGAFLDGRDGKLYVGDWDNSFGRMVDGPWINFPDQSTIWEEGANYAERPDRIYFPTDGASATESGYALSPNRQVASPVMLGSLPRAIDPDDPELSKPWQTLLFAPNPAAGDEHPGFGSEPGGTYGQKAKPPFQEPPDHLWLDFFTMPVVEPYAISEPFSTSGRINLNYQMMPFTHIERSTGIHGILKNMQLAAIPTGAADAAAANESGGWTYTATPANGDIQNQYRTGSKGNGTYHEFRYDIDVEETLKGFEERFDTGDIFRSASEICSIFLVPREFDFDHDDRPEPSRTTEYHGSILNKPVSYDTMADWWGEPTLPVPNDNPQGFLATGDNTREMPYNHIYPRVTTKSNTYRVYFTVQALKQVGGGRSTWNEDRDSVQSEYRGSAVVERYIDPNDPDLPDFATTPLNDPDAVLDKYYRFRILETKRFSP